MKMTPRDDASSEANSAQQERTLEELKAILLSEERQKIAELEEKLKELQKQLHNKEEMLSLLDPLTLTLLRKQMETNPSEVGNILGPAIGPAIRKQIASAKDDIVDALYPVIGQAIRKAVAEAMKNLARSVNQKLDQALSFRLLKARFKAKLKGVPTDEAVLSEVLPFQIHELFYIHKQSGILLAHVSSDQQKDSSVKDVISGMLTAIKNFAQDALSNDNQAQDLNVIEYDDFQIYLENGRYAFIAAVVSGVPTELFYKRIKELESSLHSKYAPLLRHFSGDLRGLEELPELLAAFLRGFQQNELKHAHAPSWVKAFALILLLLLIGLTGRSLFVSHPKSKKEIAAARQQKASQPEKILNKLSHYFSPPLHTNLQKLHLIVENNILYLQGEVNDESDKLRIAKAVAQLSGFPVIVDQLKINKSAKAIVEQINATCIYFEKGKSKIAPNEKAKLQNLLPLLKLVPNRKIRLIGHSDSLGSDLINLKISKDRAEAVKSFLIRNGINRNRIEIAAKGRMEPLSSNQSEEGRAMNRCVVFNMEERTTNDRTAAH